MCSAIKKEETAKTTIIFVSVILVFADFMLSVVRKDITGNNTEELTYNKCFFCIQS